MKIYIISDSHFGHKAMIEYCGRPENHSEIILEELKKLPDDCMLVHLGDVCIGKDVFWHNEISKLKYRKILVKGNHDGKSYSWYMNHGWDFVCDRFVWRIHEHKIVFSHKPERLYDNSINIHGHFHNALPRLLDKDYIVDGEEDRNKEDLSVLTDRHILYSPELENYKPLLLEKIIHGQIRDGSHNATKVKT